MDDQALRRVLRDRMSTDVELEELEATRRAVVAYLERHPDDVELALELESVILRISAIRGGYLETSDLAPTG